MDHIQTNSSLTVTKQQSHTILTKVTDTLSQQVEGKSEK